MILFLLSSFGRPANGCTAALRIPGFTVGTDVIPSSQKAPLSFKRLKWEIVKIQTKRDGRQEGGRHYLSRHKSSASFHTPAASNWGGFCRGQSLGRHTCWDRAAIIFYFQ